MLYYVTEAYGIEYIVYGPDIFKGQAENLKLFGLPCLTLVKMFDFVCLLLVGNRDNDPRNFFDLSRCSSFHVGLGLGHIHVYMCLLQT